MPVGINQPSNQIKFTNVSVVRLKKGMFIYDPKLLFIPSFVPSRRDIYIFELYFTPQSPPLTS
jgi:hypothetical protein